MKINLNNIKIPTETLIRLTSVIDKMDIANELKNLDKPTTEELGTEIIVLFMTNLHKAEKEIYDFVISYKDLFEEPQIDINTENYDELYEKKYNENYKKAVNLAKKYDVISIVRELLKIDGMTDFLNQQ